MMLFPVAQRELLAAARRPATYRIRVGTALLAAGIALLVLVFITVNRAGRQGGQFLFGVLWFGVIWFAVLAGSFLTADSISEERRDGTLGLMFLTDLNGFEVVAGKFIGAALNAAYGMAAVFPVMATAWFLGGITDGEFWRALLVSLNTLFVSLTLGLCVSSCARRQSRAVAVSAGLQVFLQLGVPGLVAGAGHFLKTVDWEWVNCFTPAGATNLAQDAPYLRSPRQFWTALAVSHGLGWLFLFAAGVIVARGWRDNGTVRGGSTPGLGWLTNRWDRAVRKRWTPQRVDRNPLAALFARESRTEPLAWLLASIGMVGGAAMWVMRLYMSPAGGGTTVTLTGSYMGLFGPLFVLFKALFAWEATAFFGEARRTGALDLALTAPISDPEILAAHRRHLNGTMIVPLCVLVLADALTAFCAGDPGFGIYAVIGYLGTFLQCSAMTSAGSWLSMTERRPLIAFAKTLVFGALLPSVLNYACCIGLLIPPIILVWAQGKLRLPLREVLSGARSAWQVRTTPARGH